MLHFLFLIFVFLNQIVHCDENSPEDHKIPCGQLIDCFTCTMTPLCLWKENICLDDESSIENSADSNEANNSTNKPFQTQKWYNLIPQSCTDSFSENIMRQSCLNLYYNEIPFQGRLKPTILGKSLQKSTYCKWSINIVDIQSIMLNVTLGNIANEHYYYEIHFNNGSTVSSECVRSFNKKYDKVQSVHFYFYASPTTFHESNFWFSIKNFYKITITSEFIIIISIIGGITIGVLLVALIVLSVKSPNEGQFYRDNRSENQIQNPDPNEVIRDRHELDKKQKEKIRALMIDKPFKDQPLIIQQQYAQCIICCEEFVADIGTTLTPCQHLFHYECILFWYDAKKKKPTCPVCLDEILRWYHEDNEMSKKNEGIRQIINTPSNSTTSERNINNEISGISRFRMRVIDEEHSSAVSVV